VKNAISILAVAAACLCPVMQSSGADLKIGASDSLQSTLAGQKGSRVILRTRSGQEITGAVREVNANVVQIGAISGKDYFDAVVPLSAVDVVYVRVKE
jgi:hypothetical protein